MPAGKPLNESAFTKIRYHKQPFIGIFENMHQIYKRIILSKCNFNKVAKQLY